MYTSLKKLSNILILKQEGTSRQERYMPALHVSDTLMDDRKLPDFIAYMQRYAKNLLFIDPENDQIDFEESWEYFFKNDILFLIANVATKNVHELTEVYDRLSGIFEGERTYLNFIELVEFTFSRFKKIDEWYRLSSPDPSLQHDFTLYIRSYLQTELEVIREMLSYGLYQVDDRKKLEIFRNDLSEMHGIWEVRHDENVLLREKIFAGKDDQEKLKNASILLRKTFDTVFHATDTVVKKCIRYFEDTVYIKQHFNQGHNPHVALIIAFIKLFGYAKEELNKIPQRHLHFYYREVLRIREKEPVPDQTYVIFELAKGFHYSALKKGTRLSAGKDRQNKELVYETTKAVVINKARVSALHAILIKRDAQKLIHNYYRTGFPLPMAASAEVNNIFGRPKKTAVAEIGLAIASPQLYLARGERHVVIHFESADKIQSCSPDGNLEQTRFFDTKIIKLLLTGEKGWINSDNADSEITVISLKITGETIIELDFTISIRQEQAIVAFDSSIHEGNFTTSFPVLQCMLKYPPPVLTLGDEAPPNWKEQVDQLCILQRLRVSKIRVLVQVGGIQSRISFDGVRDLIMENDESVLDNKKPFFPFTAVPKVGSSFYIGCKDFFYKKIQDLSVNMEWVLPDNFKFYYQKYLPPYDLNKFTASLYFLKSKRWKKISDVSLIDVNASDARFRSIKIGGDTLRQEETPLTGDEVIPAYDISKKDNTLRLKLNYPDFGHGVYPQLVTSAVMESAGSKADGNDYYKIVKKRLHDSVISIKMPDDITRLLEDVKANPNAAHERPASFNAIYQILGSVDNEVSAKTMVVQALIGIISEYNRVNMITRGMGQPGGAAGDDEHGRIIVNDQNFIERLLRTLRKIGLVDRNIHYDKDRQDAADVTDDLKDALSRRADFIMPPDKELESLIINGTNIAISKTVASIAEEIFVLKKQGIPKPEVIAALLKEEIDEVNEVINDMIARKIAIYLSTNEIPPPPYTPLLNNISVNYSSIKELSHEEGELLFHITPLGIIETNLLNPGHEQPGDDHTRTTLFPWPLVSSDLDMEGMLFVGFRDMQPDQNLSVLFQLAESPEMKDTKPPVVHWFYSRNNDWVKLNDDNVISDSSFGLQTTGIIEFSIPADANTGNRFFNGESLWWLCAGVEKDADAFPYLIDVAAQAVLVEFKDHKTNPGHLALPLEAEKIRTFIDEIPEIKKVRQPVSSFNGKVGENEREYFTRVSERLRHKSKAINNWDYERLVLEQFPSLYKVKCLNNYYNGDFAIGHVTVVPIADFRNRNYVGNDILLPKTSYIDLRNIELFLHERSSPFVRVHAVNPQLVHVRISCKVKFYAHINKGFYLNKLNDDLIEYLTPWASGDTDALSFSAKIYYSTIIDFIDRQNYVDYVVDLVMEQYTANEKEKVVLETELRTAHSILVSAPKHNIDLVE